jgi:hypothetical protein
MNQKNILTNFLGEMIGEKLAINLTNNKLQRS